MKFNPFNLIGGEWMLVTAGDENSCNTMTATRGLESCAYEEPKWHFKLLSHMGTGTLCSGKDTECVICVIGH